MIGVLSTIFGIFLVGNFLLLYLAKRSILQIQAFACLFLRIT